MKGLPDDMNPPDLERVPTVAEIVAQGHGIVLERTTKGEPSVFRLKPEGQAIINEAMARNAERGRAWEEKRHAQE